MKSKIDLAEHVLKLMRDVHGKDNALRRVRRQLREARSDAADVRRLQGAARYALDELDGSSHLFKHSDVVARAYDALHDALAHFGGSNENQVNHDAARLAKRSAAAAPERMTPEIEVKWVDLSPIAAEARVGGFTVGLVCRCVASAGWRASVTNPSNYAVRGVFGTRTDACAQVEGRVRRSLLDAMSFKVPARAEPAPPTPVWAQLTEHVVGLFLGTKLLGAFSIRSRNQPRPGFDAWIGERRLNPLSMPFVTREQAAKAVTDLVGGDGSKLPEPYGRQLADGIQGVILNERAYQKRKYGDCERPVSEFLMIMRGELDEAHQAWLKGSDEDALEELTQVVAVGVACMEQHGPREGHPVQPGSAQGNGAACGGRPDASTVHKRAQAPKIEVMPDRWSRA